MNVNGVTSANPSVVYDLFKKNLDIKTQGHRAEIEHYEVANNHTRDVFQKEKAVPKLEILGSDSPSFEERLEQVISLEEIQRLLLIVPPYSMNDKKTNTPSGYMLDVKK